jgi:3',5'-cyclic AMP phosphodiesterase CpdA
MKTLRFLLATGILFLAPALAAAPDPVRDPCLRATDDDYTTVQLDPLSGSTIDTSTTPLIRFVQLSDVHIYDDDGSPTLNGNILELPLDAAIGNTSAQRLQDEFTDEVLNAMERAINACDTPENPLELMIATGDNTDTMTLNETRRFIDNLDGVSGADTAYEDNCGYVTNDSHGGAKLPILGGLPCLPELGPLFAIQTGKMAADAQARTPDDSSPLDQFPVTFSPVHTLDELVAAGSGTSLVLAPGLPPALRCRFDTPGCANNRLDLEYYAVFGNHDGSIRGTLTMQRLAQEGASLPFGRYFLQSQREWVNEFFYTEELPGPVGHGFNHVEPERLADPDDRNDGYYAFDAGAKGRVRMIVMNTLYDGVLMELHRQGQTNRDLQGLVAGNEVTNPIGLADGAMPNEQFIWLAKELTQAKTKRQAVLVFSHHPDRSFADRALGFAPDGGRTAFDVVQLLGSYDNVVAWIAGHTHENIIRPCGANPGECAISGSGAQPDVQFPFWRVETSSLIDHPQEGRVVELFDLTPTNKKDAKYGLRLTMLLPDRSDPVVETAGDLAALDATCNLKSILGGPLTAGPYDAARLQTIADNTNAALAGDYCQGDEALAQAEGGPEDRDVILLP